MRPKSFETKRAFMLYREARRFAVISRKGAAFYHWSIKNVSALRDVDWQRHLG